MAEKFGKTWWGERWLRSLEDVDYDNRLPRGANYARSGHVKEIKTKDNQIIAKVQGTRSSPYRVTIIVPPFSPEESTALMERILTRPALISKLLNRELDPDILGIAEALGLKVFPGKWTDFKMNCSCPDWAVPCKHLASVIYMISREIDNNPFLVFTLHRLDLLAELARRGLVASNHERTEIPSLDSLLLVGEKDASWQENSAYDRLDFSRLEAMGDALIRLLPDAPPFYPHGNFRDKYASQLTRAMKEARRMLAGRLSFDTVFPSEGEADITRRAVFSLTIDGGNHLEITGENHAIQKSGQLIAALFALNAERLPDYSPSVAALRQTLFAALHLLAKGLVIPQLAERARGKEKRLFIRWLPASLDEGTRTMTGRLARILPPELLRAKKIIRKKETLVPLANQAEELTALFLGGLINRLTKERGDVYEDMFFHGQSRAFTGVGEESTGGGTKVWLDRYRLGTSSHRVVLTVEEGEEHSFDLTVAIEDIADPGLTPIPLQEILRQKQHEKNRFAILRHLSLLAPFIDGLDAHINQGAADPVRFDTNAFAPFLIDVLPAIRLLAIKILLPKSLQEVLRPRPSVRVRKKAEATGFLDLNSLFTFDWRVALGDENISETEFRKLLKNASKLFKFRERYFYAGDAELEKLSKIFTSDKAPSGLRLLRSALTGEYEGAPVVMTKEVRKMITSLTETEAIAQPAGLAARLRPYQERGFSWMYQNSRIGFGSVIADDMGLGKTLQVITLLLKLREEGAIGAEKRALVVVPTGLLTNWQSEFERFAPSLSVHTFHGATRDLKQFDGDVMLTSYGVVRGDANLLKKHKWQVMVIDEAQNIKNHTTAQAKAVKSIPAKIRIAMSGTPVENRLSEFWSIMDFANKGYLGTASEFNEDFARPIQIFGDEERAARFRKITAPFMMRRMKTDKSIISDLPDKIEQNQYSHLTKEQVALYEKTMNAAMDEIEDVEETDNRSLFKRQGLILQMILALKQICNHPSQFLKNGAFDPSLSGKTMLLLDLLESIEATGEKVLIFTQFTEMGDLLTHFINDKFNENPLFYHGGCSIKARSEMVHRFQEGRADKIFILSLKAAGSGLNLTAASQVIHYDLWWNPAVENQATDRAYRIGQTKNVMAHRLICKDTFEERIDDMIQNKKALAAMTVSSGESWIGKLSNRELREIFR